MVRVELIADAPVERLLRVPLGALDERGEGPRIWAVEGGRAVPHPVALRRIHGDEALIVCGLPEGAIIVAAGAHLLAENLPVRAVN